MPALFSSTAWQLCFDDCLSLTHGDDARCLERGDPRFFGVAFVLGELCGMLSVTRSGRPTTCLSWLFSGRSVVLRSTPLNSGLLRVRHFGIVRSSFARVKLLQVCWP